MTEPMALSTKARTALDASIDLALSQGAEGWSPLHLLAALLEGEYREVQVLLATLQVNVVELRARVRRLLEGEAKDTAQGAPAVSSLTQAETSIRRLLVTAAEEALLSRAPAVGVEHLLLAMTVTESMVVHLLSDFGLTYLRIRTTADPLVRRFRRWQSPFSIYRNLSAFSRDLTELARRGELDPVIGREVEMQRVMEVLSRRVKNNPILVGYAGVGKTAIIEGLAQRIAADQVPDMIRFTRIVALDIPALVAGTRVRGQLEERLQGVMQDIEHAEGSIILFIDEIHAIVGAGASDGGFDIAGMVKPALSRGQLRVIGATTPDEYRRYIERDAALERRFTPVWVAEPTPDESLAILQGMRARYEEHHRVTITDNALGAAVRMSTRYLSGRYLPDKAIDLIDEAAARVALASTMPAYLKELHDGIHQVDAASDMATVGTGPVLWQEFRQQLLAWIRTAAPHRTVTEAEVASVVSAMTGIPVGRVLEKEADRLTNLEKLLHHRIVGQHRAVTLVANAIRRARAGLSDPRRPIASFIFLGPSGVGKTELARALAEVLFDDADALIRLDMSEYMERHNVARMFGAPPGYVGYDDGGTLTELVRRRPYRIILFDEIEKAHPDVFNVLLQILDAGRLTDGHGRVVDFRNTVLIMTSNLGTGDESDSQYLLPNTNESYSCEWMEERVVQALRTRFRPEFRNRIDEVVLFEPLNERQLFQILELKLSQVRVALSLRGISLRLTDAARKALVHEGFHPVFGARPLVRTIQRRIVTPLADRLLQGKLDAGDKVTVGYGRAGYTFSVQSEPNVSASIPTESSSFDAVNQIVYRPKVQHKKSNGRTRYWSEDSSASFI